MKHALVAVAIGMGACVHGPRPPAADPLDQVIGRMIKQTPGAVVLVEHHGKVIFHRAYGQADLENHAPMTEDAVFAIGSLSKQFGAAAVLQLVEAGKLHLDDPLARYLPTFPRADRITIRDLLHHTSGIRDYEYAGTWPKTMAVERTKAEVVDVFRDLEPEFEPGTRWAYSSSNYYLLGLIVEQVSGEPIERYLEKHVFAPAGLAHTRYCDAHALIDRRALPYDVTEHGFVPARFSLFVQFGLAGALCSTARDLLAWQHALIAGKVVRPESYRLMATAAPLADGTPTGYGFGLFEAPLAGHPRVSHAGGVAGYSTALSYYPRDDLHIVVMFNTEDAPIQWTEVALARHLLAVPARPARPISREALADLAITFPIPDGKVAIAVAGDHLVTPSMGETPTPLRYVGDDTFEDANQLLEVRYVRRDGHVVGAWLDLLGFVAYEPRR